MLPPAVSIITFGCKVNQCDADEIAQALSARGYRVVGRGHPADIYLVNTCTVTATADAKARKLIRKLARAHPQARIVVTGCLAQRDPEACAKLAGVSAVVPNTNKPQIPDLLPAISSPLPPLSPPFRRTRAFLKIQDGCDHRCAYCAVPHARGRPVSKPMEQVLSEVERFASAGAQELVLCGIRLGAYGRDRGDGGLSALLRQLRRADIPRLRLSSLEPMDVPEELIAEIADHPQLCHHLHLPLQSGDDAILAAMGRGYTVRDFASLVARARAAWPDIAVTTDIMVGFPGEAHAQFQRTLDLARDIAFSRVHVFPYSPRPGTPAAAFPQTVPAAVLRGRTERILSLARDLAGAAARAWVGRELPVLFEERSEDGILTGLTEHYIRARCPGPRSFTGAIVTVVARAEENGELISELPPPDAPPAR